MKKTIHLGLWALVVMLISCVSLLADTQPGRSIITKDPSYTGSTVQFRMDLVSDYGPDVFIDDFSVAGPVASCLSTTMPYSMDFDSWPPACWNIDGGAATPVQYGGDYMEGSFWNWNDITAEAVSQPVQISSNAEVSYRWSHLYHSNYPNDQVLLMVREVGTTAWDTISNLIGSSFSSLGAGTTTPSADADFVTELISLDPSYIGLTVEFRMDLVSDNGSDVFIDDFSVMAAPCPNPLALGSTNVTSSSADVYWDANGNTNFSIEYGPAGFVLGNGTTMASSNDTAAIAGLMGSTGYDFYVQSDCGTDGLSAWSGPSSFSTLCASATTMPYTMDFDSWPPVCWDIYGGGATPVHNGGDYMEGSFFYWNHLNAEVVSQAIQISTDAKVRYRWSHLHDPFYPNDQVLLMVREVGTTAWDTINNLIGPSFSNPGAANQAPSPDADFVTEIISLDTSYTGSTVEFRMDLVSGYGPDVFIDDFSVMAAPCPNPLALGSTNMTTSSADVYWSGNGNTNFNIEYGLAGFVLGTGTTMASSNDTATIAGLMDNTSYDFYVQSDCGGNRMSVWSGPSSFSTLCLSATTMPYTMDFDSWPPACWDIDGGAATPVQYGGDYMEGSFFYWNHLNAEVVSQAIQISTDAEVRYRWSHLHDPIYPNDQVLLMVREVGTTAWDTISDLIGPSFSSPGAGNTTPSADADFLTEVISLDPSYTGSTVEFRMDLVSDYGSDVFIDDFSVMAAPCLNPLALGSTNVTSSSADVYWDANANGNTNFSIEYGPAGFVQGTGTTMASSNDTATIAGLMANTSYDFYVNSDCGGNGMSVWSGPSSFSTLCASATTMPYTMDFDSWPPACWDIDGGAATPVQYGGDYMEGSFWTWTNINAEVVSQAIQISTDAEVRYRWSHSYHLSYPNDQVLLMVREVGTTAWDTISDLIGPSFDSPGAGNTTPSADADFVTEVISLDLSYTGSTVEFRMDLVSGYGPNVFIDDFSVMVLPLCASPLALGSTNVTSSSADVYWDANANGNTNFSIEYGPAGFVQGTGTTMASSNDTAAIAGLMANTSYDFYVNSDCGGNGLSAWSGPFSFSTFCVSATTMPYTMDFDSWPPACWDIDGGAATPSQYGGDYMEGSFFYWNDITAEVVSQAIQISSNAEVSYRWSHLSTSSSSNDQVLLMVREVGTTAWDTISNLIGPSFSSLGAGNTTPSADADFVTEVISLDPSYTGSTVEFRMDLVSDYGSDVFIDDFSLMAAPCLNPLALGSTHVTSSSADVYWDGNGNTNFSIEYGPAGFVLGAGTTMASSNDTAAIAGLMGGTSYDFYVQSDCGGNRMSAWSGPFSFSTLCLSATTMPYSMDFDSWPPACWDIDGGAATPSQYGGDYMEGSFYGWNNITAEVVSQAIQISSNAEVSYRWSHLYNPSYPNDQVVLMVREMGTTAWDTICNLIGPSFSSPGAGTTTPSADADFVTEVISLDTSYTGSTVEFRMDLVSGFGSDVFIDDFSVMAAPACLNPLALGSTHVTSSSADVYWDANGNTNFSIEYGPAGFVQGSGTTMASSNDTAAIAGLMGNTSYDFYVNSDCGGNGMSAWSGPSGFSTLCLSTAMPYSMDFDSWPPACWDIDGGAATPVQYGGDYMEGSFWNWNDITAEAVSQPVQISSNAEVSYRWSHLYHSNYPNDQVLLMVREVGTTAWDTISHLIGPSFSSLGAGNTTPSADADFVTEVISLDPSYTGSTVQFRMDLVSDWGPDVFIDDFSVMVPPCPNPLALGSTNVTSSSADVYWDANGNANFSFEYGPAGFVQGTGTTMASSNDTAAIAGLMGSTSYDFYVQSDCGTDGLSAWSGPSSFSTLCASATAMPYSMDFDSWPPACWDIDGGAATPVQYGGDYMEGSFWDWDDITAEVVSQAIQISSNAEVSYRWSHLYSITFPNDQVVLMVREVGTTAWDTISHLIGPSFSSLGAGNTTPSADADFITEVISLDTSYTGSTVEFRMDLVSDHGSDVFIDDFSVMVPPCLGPLALGSTNVTSSSADVYWDGNGNANFSIEYGPAGFVQGTGTTMASSNDTAAIAGLMANTSYDFYVQSDCGGNGMSAWSGPSSFSTLCLSATTMPYSMDFDSWPPACWDIDGGAATPVQYGGDYMEGSFWTWNDITAETVSQPVQISSNAEVSYRWSHLYNPSYPNDQVLLMVREVGTTAWDTISDLIGPSFSSPGAGNTTPSADADFITEIISLDPSYTGSTVQFRMDLVSDWGPDVFIDDFSVAGLVTSCLSIDSIVAVNANLGVYRAYFDTLAGTSWELEYKGINDTAWRSKTINRSLQKSQKFNITPSFGTDVLVRIVSQDSSGTNVSCEATIQVPCKQQNLNIITQIEAFCEGDSVLLRAGYSGGYRTPAFLWSNGATTKRTYVNQGEKLIVTVTDLAGCSVTDSITVPFLNTVGAPTGFILSKNNATTFTGNWTASSLPIGASLIGYRMAYRQANVGASWVTTSLSSNTTATVDFTGSGNVSANYEFTSFARINDNGSVYNTEYACLDRKFYNGSGSKSEGQSLDENGNTIISIYPNPTNSKVYVQAELGAKIQLFDLQGKLLSEKEALSNETAFDLSAYSKGVYMMKVTTDERVVSEQVMKN